MSLLSSRHNNFFPKKEDLHNINTTYQAYLIDLVIILAIYFFVTAPVYKPKPSPYEARQILTPDSSVKKYSFKIIEPEIPEEARQSKAIEAQPNSINEIIPEEDYDEEIATEGDLLLFICICIHIA